MYLVLAVLQGQLLHYQHPQESIADAEQWSTGSLHSCLKIFGTPCVQSQPKSLAGMYAVNAPEKRSADLPPDVPQVLLPLHCKDEFSAKCSQDDEVKDIAQEADTEEG